MKLKSISARNFKGQSFDEPLSPLTVLVGQNFAGKTARTDAIRLLLLGHLPELGLTARATFGLSSGKDMEVAGVFDNGLTIRRRFYLKGDTVKVEEEIPQAIADCGQLAVMLDSESYFALSDRKRVEYVFDHCQMGEGFTEEIVLVRLGETLRDGKASQEQAEKMLQRLAPEIGIAKSVQLFVENSIVVLTEAGKEAKAYADRMDKTVQGLAGLRLTDPTQGADLATLDARHSIITREIGELHERKSARSADYTAMITARGRRESIKGELAKVEAHRTRRANLALSLITLNTQLAEIPDSSVTMETLLKLAQSNQAAVNEARREYKERFKARLEAEYQLTNIAQQTACPYCGAKGEGWKALKTAELNTAIEQASARCTELERAGKLAADALTLAQADIDRLKETDRKADALEHEQRTTEREIAQLDTILARVSPLEEELAKLVPESSELVTAVELIQTELNVKNADLRTIDTARRAVMGRANDLQRLAQAEEERDKAKSEVEVAALVLKKLREIQGEMVEAAFKPLLNDANRFFAHVLPSHLAYRDGEIGTWRGGVWVGHRTFSGVEKLLTYAAIQAALAVKSPVRIMILDEMLRAQGEVFDQIIAGVRESLEIGRLDGFVGIIPGAFENYRHLAGMGCDLVEIKG